MAPEILVAIWGVESDYGSNFGSSKELAERFAERSRTYGYSSEVLPLNDLVDMPARTQPWLLVVMTATYTANPPSNAIAFKAWLERTDAPCIEERRAREVDHDRRAARRDCGIDAALEHRRGDEVDLTGDAQHDALGLLRGADPELPAFGQSGAG